MSKAFTGALDCKAIGTLNGDFLSPCVLTALDGGKAMLEALDVAGFDYVCLGNHEFDIGIERLASNLGHLQSCKVINSNVHNKELATLPKNAVVTVGDKTVLVGGFLTNDSFIYPPSMIPGEPRTFRLLYDMSHSRRAPPLFRFNGHH